jgi:hypothetical protein
MTQCTACGQTITEVVTIDGMPYGTTCAQNKLGIREFPNWFKGGDWNSQKEIFEITAEKNAQAFAEARMITAEFWEEWHKLSSIKDEAYKQHNDWLYEFVGSILTQLGYANSLCNMPSTLEEAENNSYHKRFICYLYKKPKRISQLSPKQLAILNKYL